MFGDDDTDIWHFTDGFAYRRDVTGAQFSNFRAENWDIFQGRLKNYTSNAAAVAAGVGFPIGSYTYFTPAPTFMPTLTPTTSPAAPPSSSSPAAASSSIVLVIGIIAGFIFLLALGLLIAWNKYSKAARYEQSELELVGDQGDGEGALCGP